MDNTRIADLLNDLVAYLYDSQMGYQTCAEGVDHQPVSELCKTLANKRAEMAESLKEKIRSLSNEPSESGTVAGATHRLFVNLKSLLTGGDLDAIINEIKRGENTLIQQYRKTLRDDIFEDLRYTLIHQLEQIEKDLTEIDKAGSKKEANIL